MLPVFSLEFRTSILRVTSFFVTFKTSYIIMKKVTKCAIAAAVALMSSLSANAQTPWGSNPSQSIYPIFVGSPLVPSSIPQNYGFYVK